MMTETKDERETGKEPGKIARDWQVQLALSDQDHKSFIEDGRKVYERYKSEKTTARSGANRRFNILYSNTEVMRSALYGRAAKPDVRRRFPDRNPTARQAAEVLERSLVYVTDAYDVDIPIEAAVQDYLLPGRGTCRVDYEPQIASRPVLDMMGQPMMGEDGAPISEDFIADQKVCLSYVFWEDFRCEPARNWAGVNWIAFRHTLSRDELREDIYDKAPPDSETFGDPDSVPLNWSPDVAKEKQIPDDLKKAEVWEIWCKRSRRRYWIVNGHSTPLRIDADPYGLEQFYPLPEPPTSYSTTDTIIPEPEFYAYRDQADDLDEITARISRLTRALKRRGVYDKTVQELRRLASAADNEFIPVENYTALAQKGGLAAAFQTEDITVIAGVLLELYKQRDMLVQSIYEVTGISDIIRGATNPNETLGAQQLKSQFGSLRLKRRQRSIQRWIRDLYRIMAEIIAEHFDPAVLSEMTQTQVTPEIMQMLRTEKARGYNVNIETDSTIFEDAEGEKQSRVELLTAMGGFLQQAVQVGQASPQLTPLLFDMLSFGIRGFKAGRELEDRLDEVAQQIQQAASQPRPPRPNPDEERIKMEREKHQMDMEGKVIDLQVHQAKAQSDIQKMQAQAAMAPIAPPMPGV